MRKILLIIFFSLLLFTYPVNNSGVLADESTSTKNVKAGCEFVTNIETGNTVGYKSQDFKNPETIKSKDGELKTNLRVEYSNPDTTMIGNCHVRLRTYNGSLVGPTLRVKPGDKITINLINNLPPEEHESDEKITTITLGNGLSYQEMEGVVPNEPHGFNTTNFHAHGLHVSPKDLSDNVLRVMQPKENEGDQAPEYRIEIEIPENHPSGTYWYHAHKHGSTALQVSSGMI